MEGCEVSDAQAGIREGQVGQGCPQCGLCAKLDDIQSCQIACLPKENSFNLIKMIRTAITKIHAAMYSDPYMVDIALLKDRKISGYPTEDVHGTQPGYGHGVCLVFWTSCGIIFGMRMSMLERCRMSVLWMHTL